ncbi:hypothetical protein WH80_01335 [Streptococcus dysgalactiae subsp. equisimilis]|nr:hypothetical protein WH80_01335 [Streptococcus dysgalactiae subsp. equisimilis]OBZ03109.1 hypothetical protein BBG04_00900 [Streptococcus dysgalactiae subsp. equisimilis]OCX04346.1 hypothetical protein BBG07_00320 [Streptococcus dysgalactiae subsp. equisimilis]
MTTKQVLRLLSFFRETKRSFRKLKCPQKRKANQLLHNVEKQLTGFKKMTMLVKKMIEGGRLGYH